MPKGIYKHHPHQLFQKRVCLIEKTCLQCGVKKLFYPSHATTRKKYCSKKCYSYSKKGKPMKCERYIAYKDKHHNWNNGIYNNHAGYRMLSTKDHPSKQKYVMEHRLVMEKHLGRYLKPNEVIHHINEIKTDNRIENLKLCSSQAEHRRLHATKI